MSSGGETTSPERTPTYAALTAEQLSRATAVARVFVDAYEKATPQQRHGLPVWLVYRMAFAGTAENVSWYAPASGPTPPQRCERTVYEGWMSPVAIRVRHTGEDLVRLHTVKTQSWELPAVRVTAVRLLADLDMLDEIGQRLSLEQAAADVDEKEAKS